MIGAFGRAYVLVGRLLLGPWPRLDRRGGDGGALAGELGVHRLDGGTRVLVRCLRPADEEMLRAAFHELSPQSRYQRFLSPISELSDDLWKYLCSTDGRDHVALVALPEGEASIVGVARFIRQSIDRTTAEVALTVADAWQRRGLGSLLLGLSIDLARQRGIETFVAYALPQNVAIRRLLARRGPVESRAVSTEEELRLRLTETERRTGRPGA